MLDRREYHQFGGSALQLGLRLLAIGLLGRLLHSAPFVMRLRDARLCLDCEEVHQDEICPICGSESFAYISRWVPVPDPERAPRPSSTPEADVYRALLGEEPATPKSPNRRGLKGGLLGLTALGLAGWAWRSSRPGGKNKP